LKEYAFAGYEMILRFLEEHCDIVHFSHKRQKLLKKKLFRGYHLELENQQHFLLASWWLNSIPGKRKVK
jgi:hypothetical protein